MGETLTPEELTGLRWSASCNQDGCGYLGPTVAKTGPFSAYKRLVSAGLLEVREFDCRVEGPRADRFANCGYWITDAGRAALQTSTPSSDRLADERSASKSPNSSDPSAIAEARERLGRTAWPVKDSGHPGASEATIADLRTLLADRARLDAENARLRQTCQPFAKAWAMGCRVLRHNGKVHEVASRASLGLTEDGPLQVGDFERLVRALTNREGQDNG